MTWIAWALTLLWVLTTLRDLRATRAVPTLPPSPEHPPPGPSPTVTAVVAIRDDGAGLTGLAATMLAQRDVDLKLVVADDRSDDDTPRILAQLCAEHPAVTGVRIDALPPGWLGKTHALHRATAAIDGEWILFADGDTRLAPDTVRRAIDAAATRGADHVTLVPGHSGTTMLGRACLVAFHQVVVRRLLAVNAEPQRSYAGAGAFNLVRTAAYRRVGGHEPLRMEVVDDVCLGQLLFRGGCRSVALLAPRDLVVEWGGRPMELLRVVEKNMFAVLRFRTGVAALIATLVTGLLAVTAAAPLLFGTAGVWTVLACAAGALPGARLARRLGWNSWNGALVPIARALLVVALVRSTCVTLWRGGIRWRGTFYPLADLRRGCVR